MIRTPTSHDKELRYKERWRTGASNAIYHQPFKSGLSILAVCTSLISKNSLPVLLSKSFISSLFHHPRWRQGEKTCVCPEVNCSDIQIVFLPPAWEQRDRQHRFHLRRSQGLELAGIFSVWASTLISAHKIQAAPFPEESSWGSPYLG